MANKLFVVSDSDFDTTELNEVDGVIFTERSPIENGVLIAKNVSVQIGFSIGGKVIEWTKELSKEVLTGK